MQKFPNGNVEAVFIPETAAERLAEAKAARALDVFGWESQVDIPSARLSRVDVPASKHPELV